MSIWSVGPTFFGIALCIGILLLTPTPAWAHTADGTTAASDYRTRITSVRPAISGLSLRIVQQNTRIELTNRTGSRVEVLGYEQEPYLRVDSDAVYVNERSPSTYVNEDLGSSGPPDEITVSAHAKPLWRQISHGPVARWHDHRTHWMSAHPPPSVHSGEPGPRQLFVWHIQLRVGEKPVTVAGALTYFPPPHAVLWWGGIVVAMGIIVVASRWRYGTCLLASLLTVAAIAELATCVGEGMDAGESGPGLVSALFTDTSYTTIAAVAAVCATIPTWRRHPAGPFALATAGMCLGLLGGVPEIAVFVHEQADAPWAGTLARTFTAITIALSAGVAIGAMWEIRRSRKALNTKLEAGDRKARPERRRGANTATPENGPLDPPPLRSVQH